MRIAIIDLGTNSVRFDVHQIGPGKVVKTLHREKIMVRLGQGVFTNGELDSDAIHRTKHAFNVFKRIAQGLRVSRIVALATSAMREATDSNKFVVALRKATGIDVKVISGPEEARLIALGILSNEKVGKGKVGLIDIGGGSTEITIVQDGKILHSESFPLGTARLQQVFLKKSPPSHGSVEELRIYIRKTLANKIVAEQWPKPVDVIGSSGTIRALTRIVKKDKGKRLLKTKDLSVLIKKMQRMTTTQLLGIAGIEAKRVDMILAGAVLLEECLFALRADKLRPTEFSLRDGILQEQIELSTKHMTSQIGLHLDDLIEKAEVFGGHKKQLNAIVAMSEQVFKSLHKLHKLGRDWRLYLDAAAILRNVGESVSLIGHQEHSCYIVKNAKFPFVEPWESDFVAELCFRHEEHKFDPKKLPQDIKGSRRDAFSKVLAMLWLIDALDLDPRAPVQIKSVSVLKSRVHIVIDGGTGTDLEIFRVNQRKALFKTVFKKDLEVARV